MIAFMYVAVAVIAYLCGSIPCGVLISKWLTKRDVRKVGSGKTGMTNVLRTAGRKAAAISLVLDIAKGALAVGIAGLIFWGNEDTVAVFTFNESAKILAGLAAIVGHNWSIFLKFKGGRGVATFMGALAGLYWPAAVLGGVLIFLVGLRTKYMSMGSLVGAVGAFFLLTAFYILKIDFLRSSPMPVEYSIFVLIGVLFVWVMHRDNITRLYNGTERKIGEKHKASAKKSTKINTKVAATVPAKINSQTHK
jgi:glycerol-3-phosphate acyltransferase PlsY